MFRSFTHLTVHSPKRFTIVVYRLFTWIQGSIFLSLFDYFPIADVRNFPLNLLFTFCVFVFFIVFPWSDPKRVATTDYQYKWFIYHMRWWHFSDFDGELSIQANVTHTHACNRNIHAACICWDVRFIVLVTCAVCNDRHLVYQIGRESVLFKQNAILVEQPRSGME